MAPMEFQVENNHLNIKKIGYQINVVADFLRLDQCNLYKVLQDAIHADDNVD